MNERFELSMETRALIRERAERVLSLLPDQLGIDEFIGGCRVVDLGGGPYPRTITVALRGYWNLFARLRGDIGLAVGDIVTVVHVRDGDFYEVYGRGGAAGGAAQAVHTHGGATQGGPLVWATLAAAAGANLVHDHSSNAQGGQNLLELLLLRLADSTELTINAGVVTMTQAYHRIDTEADAASDDLDTINGGTEGDFLLIRAESDARTVVVKHNTGNIWFLGKVNLALDDAEDHLLLFHNGSKWCVLGAGGDGAAVASAQDALHWVTW